MATPEEIEAADKAAETRMRTMIREETSTAVEEKVKAVLTDFFDTVKPGAPEPDPAEPDPAEPNIWSRMQDWLSTE